MIRIAFFLIFLSGCASTAYRMPDGEKIPSGVDTIVLASNKTALEFSKELKQRVVQKDFYFLHTDEDTKSFLTDFYDVTKRSSVQIRVYVKDVPNGSNAVINGRFIDLKKLKKYPYWRSQSIEYQGKGKASRHAWEALHNYAVGSNKWKHTFLKR
ncbi:MAG: hypothetical protein ACRBBP_00415 [Bdellovibrionales bacterium]